MPPRLARRASLARVLALLLPGILVLLPELSPSPAARPVAPLPWQQRVPASCTAAGRARDASGVQPDTVWFGGNDPARPGYAFVGGLWDWETAGGEDPLQGWTSRDLSENEAIWFARVTAADFATAGDPCVPIFPGEIGQLWCGMHEADALARDWAAGMGYGHNWCQRAHSPRHPLEPGDAIQIGLRYFQHSEENWDFTYIGVRCFNAAEQFLGEVLLDALTGVAGSPSAPAIYSGSLAYADLPCGPQAADSTRAIEIVLRFESDPGTDDEDGLFDSPCGPFAADEITLSLGGLPVATYDFESDAEGWSFTKCPGAGAQMAVWSEAAWVPWIDAMYMGCQCWLAGNALGFASEIGAPLPGLPVGQHEAALSGILDRTGTPYQDPEYNAAVGRWDVYYYLPQEACTFVRRGCTYYPYTTAGQPTPHWSPLRMEPTYSFIGPDPKCEHPEAFDLSGGVEPPLPSDWEQLRLVYEVIADGAAFGHDPSYCWAEGETAGSPLLDHVRLGLTHRPDAPQISLEHPHQFHDGFGQRFPTHLDPGDVGTANIQKDFTTVYTPGRNHWQADTAVIVGPTVTSEANRWLCEMLVKVTRKGPRQEMIPGYTEWKGRLAGDVESEFVAVLMDSSEGLTGPAPNWFVTYFHEADPGFDPHYADHSPAQEILPDSVFTPGTRIAYAYRGFWYNGGAPPEDYFYYPGYWPYAHGEMEDGYYEFEILPGMRAAEEGTEGEYSVVWPCVLYVDASDAGADGYITAALDALGLTHDRYDYLGAHSCCHAPLARSYGGTHYNPGGWGNSGVSTDQLLGYRLILLNTGQHATGTTEVEDYDLLEAWLTATTCGLGDVRRGLILNGDRIPAIIGNPTVGVAPEFLHDYLGARWVNTASYRAYNDDWAACVYLEPAAGGEFAPHAPGIALYGNGCPVLFSFAVLDVEPDVPGAVGNLSYWSYEGTGTLPYIDYAQVVRENYVPGTANWRTVIDGFSLHHLSGRGCGGGACSSDSACIVSGILDLLGPEIDWLEGGEPFEPWNFLCSTTGVEEGGEAHLAGRVSYLYPVHPNPFRSTAAVRFCLEAEQEAEVTVYDVTGRRLATLVSGACPAGETTVVWDGRDDRGRPVGPGIYWVQLRTPGYCSSKRLVTLE